MTDGDAAMMTRDLTTMAGARTATRIVMTTTNREVTKTL
jgi:hypothetical protein